MTVTYDFDTKLLVNQQGGGLFSIRDAAETPGKIFWVGSNVTGATDGDRYGKNPGAPFATLDYAIGKTTADRGDTIYVMPSHAETAAGTDQELFDVDKASVSVMGLGIGDKRPTFTFTDDGATVVLGKAGCRLSNLRFIGNVTDYATCLEIEGAADGCIVDHCYFADTASGADMLVPISIAADADRLMIVDNHFNCVTGGEATDCILMAGGSDGTIVARNLAAGDWKTGGFLNCSVAASLGLIVIDNIVVNQDTAAGLCYKGHASSTGLIARNMFAASKDGTECINEITAMHVSQNYMTDLPAASGIISATVTAW